MAEFNRDLQNLKPSFSEMNSSSSNLLDISNNYQTALTDNYDHQQILAFSNHQQQPHPHLPINFANNFQSLFNVSASSSSSPSAVSGTGLSLNENIKSFGRRKRKRKDEDMEKPKDVIHVRAKRGQATDSHSLAERARREKINEKLRCLQDLVPGCYKAMGMAVMLDVIINYVHSLQNQIEFLSTKLSAASMHYDFNLERDNMETVQATNAYELQEMETMEREGYGGPSNYFHTHLGSFD